MQPFSRACLTLAALTLSALLLAAAARPTSILRPQTLVRVSSPIRGFALDGKRIAWLTGTDGRKCVRILHVRSLVARRTDTARQTGCTSDSEYVSGLALAGRAAAWDSFVAGGNTEFDAAIETATVPARRAHRVASVHGTRGDGYPESYSAVAGAGSFLAYSVPTGVRRLQDRFEDDPRLRPADAHDENARGRARDADRPFSLRSPGRPGRRTAGRGRASAP